MVNQESEGTMSVDKLEYAGYTLEAGRSPTSWVLRDVHGREVGDFTENELIALHDLANGVLGACDDPSCACYNAGYQKAKETID